MELCTITSIRLNVTCVQHELWHIYGKWDCAVGKRQSSSLLIVRSTISCCDSICVCFLVCCIDWGMLTFLSYIFVHQIEFVFVYKKGCFPQLYFCMKHSSKISHSSAAIFFFLSCIFAHPFGILCVQIIPQLLFSSLWRKRYTHRKGEICNAVEMRMLEFFAYFIMLFSFSPLFGIMMVMGYLLSYISPYSS